VAQPATVSGASQQQSRFLSSLERLCGMIVGHLSIDDLGASQSSSVQKKRSNTRTKITILLNTIPLRHNLQKKHRWTEIRVAKDEPRLPLKKKFIRTVYAIFLIWWPDSKKLSISSPFTPPPLPFRGSKLGSIDCKSGFFFTNWAILAPYNYTDQ